MRQGLRVPQRVAGRAGARSCCRCRRRAPGQCAVSTQARCRALGGERLQPGPWRGPGLPRRRTLALARELPSGLADVEDAGPAKTDHGIGPGCRSAVVFRRDSVSSVEPARLRRLTTGRQDGNPVLALQHTPAQQRFQVLRPAHCAALQASAPRSAAVLFTEYRGNFAPSRPSRPAVSRSARARVPEPAL